MKTCRFLLTFALVKLTVMLASAQPAAREIPLYPAAIPNARAVADPETVEERANGNDFIFGTARPTLTIYRPAKPNGQAIVICPGGGYRGVSIVKEGHRVAQHLTEAGITAFVLKYRTPQDTTNIDKSLAPLQDAQQALRYVRQQAAGYGIDPRRVGIMGFSAGGHLAATAATYYQRPADANQTDTTSLRPDFVALIYPVISFADELAHVGSRTNLLGAEPRPGDVVRFSADQQVNSATPPAFLVHAADDQSVPVGNSLAFYAACVAAGVPAEMHLYARGGHGFGLDNPTTPDRWLERLLNWLTTL